MSEAATWRAIRPGLQAICQCERVENRVGAGMPDVYICSEGRSVWVELKKATPPRRASTPFAIKNLRRAQIIWHRNHARSGGLSWLLVQYGTEWILFSGRVLDQLAEPMTQTEAREIATEVWTSLPDPNSLLNRLTRNGE
jgi:hypothetical protein